MFKKLSIFISAVSILAGTIIGVGLFSLPYITLRVGWSTLLLYFAVLGLFVILIHLFFGELALKTPNHRRLPGFVGIYLGRGWKKLSLVSHSLGLLGAILAYIIVGGEFLYTLLHPVVGGSPGAYTLVYFAAGSLIILFGIRAIEKIQVLGLVAFMLIIIGLIWHGRTEVALPNLFARSNEGANWFLPYGVVLFSFWGASLVPQIKEMLGRRKQLLPKIISVSIILPMMIYLVFIAAILGITGAETTPSALPGLVDKLGPRAEILLLAFGLITTFTSYIALGLTLKQVMNFDFRIGERAAWALTSFVPILLYFLGVKNFIQLIAFVGAVMLAVDGILILLMYHRGVPQAAPWKKLASRALILVLLIGIMYEIANFL